MVDRALAMVNFECVLEEMGFNIIYSRVLIARDIPGEYMRYMTQTTRIDNAVFMFETRADITDLCRQEEKRMGELTGVPKHIDDTEVACIFILNNVFGIVSDIPISEARWRRYFKMDPNAPCMICDEVDKKRTVCGNCTVVVCLECDEKIESNACPGCKLEIGKFDA